MHVSFFCPGRQPRFAACFTSKGKEGGLLCHKPGILLVQSFFCLTVFFAGGNSHKFLTDIQARGATRGAKTQHHSTPTKSMTAQEEPLDLSQLEGSIIKLGKTQHLIEWFQNQFNQICGFELNQQQPAPIGRAWVPALNQALNQGFDSPWFLLLNPVLALASNLAWFQLRNQAICLAQRRMSESCLCTSAVDVNRKVDL